MNWITGQKHILARVRATGKVTEPAGIKNLPNACLPFPDPITAMLFIRLDYIPDINLANKTIA